MTNQPDLNPMLDDIRSRGDKKLIEQLLQIRDRLNLGEELEDAIDHTNLEGAELSVDDFMPNGGVGLEDSDDIIILGVDEKHSFVLRRYTTDKAGPNPNPWFVEEVRLVG